MITETRKVPARTVRSYRCGICRTKYHSKKQAKKCESRILEKNGLLGEGDQVMNIEPRTCFMGRQQPYYFRGTIVRVFGPQPSDYEYECKWLGGKPERVNGHIYQYEVGYVCPTCKKSQLVLYYGPELRRISKSND